MIRKIGMLLIFSKYFANRNIFCKSQQILQNTNLFCESQLFSMLKKIGMMLIFSKYICDSQNVLQEAKLFCESQFMWIAKRFVKHYFFLRFTTEFATKHVMICFLITSTTNVSIEFAWKILFLLKITLSKAILSGPTMYTQEIYMKEYLFINETVLELLHGWTQAM